MIDRNNIFGRTESFSELESVISEIDEASRFIFLKGDAGIGKTTVLKGLLDSHQELLSVYVQCSSLTDNDEMYKPCNDVFASLKDFDPSQADKAGKVRGFLSSVAQSKVVNVGGKILGFIPGLGTASAVIDLALTAMADDGEKLDEKVERYKNDRIALYADMIVGVSKVRPLVVVFDDLHWADKGTTNVIKQIYQMLWEAERTEGAHLCLICAMRESEAKADKLHNGVNELLSFVNRYDKNIATEISLSPLTDEAVQQLLSYGFDNNEELSDGLKQWITQKSMGNPLLLETYINLLKSNNIVSDSMGAWKDDSEVEVSGGQFVLKGKMLAAEKKGIFNDKAAVALEALKNLKDINLKVMYVAAIMDKQFPVDVLARAINIPEEELFWHLRSLEKMGLISDLGSENNGFEEINRYEITSRILKEALQNDMSKRQISVYEQRIAEAYAEKADTVSRFKSLLNGMADAEMLPQNKIDVKASELDDVKNSMHYFAATHYEKAGCILSAIDHGLYCYKNSVAKFEKAYENQPSPADLDTIIYTVEGQMKHYEDLFEEVLSEMLLSSEEDKEKLQLLRIKFLTINAQFYRVFGYFNKAIDNISQAQQLALTTDTDSDDVDMMLEMIKIAYASGDYKRARSQVDIFVTYFEKHAGWDVEELENIFIDVADFFIEDFVMAELYADRIIKILVSNKSEYVEGILSSYYSSLMINECFIKADEIYAQIASINGYGALLIDLTNLCEQITDENFNSYYEDADTFGEPAKICYRNSFNWKWRVHNAEKILSVYKNMLQTLEMPIHDKCELLYGSFKLLIWLKQHSEIPDLVEDEDTIGSWIVEGCEEDYEELRKDIKEFNMMSKKTLAEYESFFATKENVQFSLEYTGEKVSEAGWYNLASFVPGFWPKLISLDEYNRLFVQMMNSPEVSGSVDDIIETIDSAFMYFSEAQYNEEMHKLVDYVINELIEKSDNAKDKARYIEKSILDNSETYYPREWIDELDYLLKAIDYYIEAGESESALDLIDTYSELEGFDLPKNIQKEYFSKIKDAEKREMVAKESKSINSLVDISDDDFIKWKEAEKILRTIYLGEDDEEEIPGSEYVSKVMNAFHLIENNKLAETRKDDFCDEVAKKLFLYGDELSTTDIKEIFGVDCKKPEIWAVCVRKTMEFLSESLKINEGLKDCNRIIEEAKKIIYYYLGYLDSDEDNSDPEPIVSDVLGVGEEHDVTEIFIDNTKKYGREWKLVTFLLDSAYDFDWLEEGLEELSISICEALNECLPNEKIKSFYSNFIATYYPNNAIKKKLVNIIK